jgi:hypothetical protein
MSRRKAPGRGPKQKSDNIVIVYSIIFCIVLVVYIRYIM